MLMEKGIELLDFETIDQMVQIHGMGDLVVLGMKEGLLTYLNFCRLRRRLIVFPRCQL